LTSASGTLPTLSMEDMEAEITTRLLSEAAVWEAQYPEKVQKPPKQWKAGRRQKCKHKKGRKKAQQCPSNTWVLWTNVDSPPSESANPLSASDYNKGLRKVGEVHSREELCELWNTSYVRDKFLEKEDVCFCLFRKGIAPTWEDSANSKGGSMGMSFKQLDTAENVWLSILMTLTMVECQESLHYNEINGHVFKSRKWGYAVAVWNKYSHNKRFKCFLQNYFETELAVPQRWMAYKAHHLKRATSQAEKQEAQEAAAVEAVEDNQNAGIEGTEEESSDRPGHGRASSLTVIQEEEEEEGLHHSNSACEFEPLRKTTPFSTLDDALFADLVRTDTMSEGSDSDDGSVNADGSSDEDSGFWESEPEESEPKVIYKRRIGEPGRPRSRPSSPREAKILAGLSAVLIAITVSSVLSQLLM